MLRFIAQMLEGHREAQAYGKRPGSGEGICMYIHMYACMCVCMHRCECGHNKFFGTRNGTGTECKNRKKRNRSQGGRSPQFCVCIMLHVCGCTVGWLAGPPQGWSVVRQQGWGCSSRPCGPGGWTGRFDGGSLMPKQSKILRLYPCLQASHGPTFPLHAPPHALT